MPCLQKIKVDKSMDVCCIVKCHMRKQKITFTLEVPEPVKVKPMLFKNKQELKRKHTVRERKVILVNECNVIKHQKKKQEKSM